MCDYNKKIKSQHWRTLQLMLPAFETIIKGGCDISEDHERYLLISKELEVRGKHVSNNDREGTQEEESMGEVVQTTKHRSERTVSPTGERDDLAYL